MACGRGAVAVWLALRGLVVDAVDVSPVRAGRRRAGWRPRTGSRPACGAGRTISTPACRPAAPAPTTWSSASGSAIPRLYPRLADGSRPGGLLVVTVLSEVGEEPGRWRAAPG